MSDFNPKQGEMILVGHGQGCPVCMREFVVLLAGVYHCKSHNADEIKLIPWEYAKPLPDKPELTTFTRETWPKQPVWMKATTENEVMEQVVAIDTQGVFSQNGFVSFSTAAVDYLISLDFCQTWQPCHYVPEIAE